MSICTVFFNVYVQVLIELLALFPWNSKIVICSMVSLLGSNGKILINTDIFVI